MEWAGGDETVSKRIIPLDKQELFPHLAVPAQRQVLGVVDDLVVFVFALALAELLLLLLLALLSSSGLFPLDVFMRQLSLLLQEPARPRGSH